jgi:hypothetical protein
MEGPEDWCLGGAAFCSLKVGVEEIGYQTSKGHKRETYIFGRRERRKGKERGL